MNTNGGHSVQKEPKLLPYFFIFYFFNYYLVDEPDKVTGGRHHNANEVKAGHYWVDRGHPETAP